MVGIPPFIRPFIYVCNVSLQKCGRKCHVEGPRPEGIWPGEPNPIYWVSAPFCGYSNLATFYNMLAQKNDVGYPVAIDSQK